MFYIVKFNIEYNIFDFLDRFLLGVCFNYRRNALKMCLVI